MEIRLVIPQLLSPTLLNSSASAHTILLFPLSHWREAPLPVCWRTFQQDLALCDKAPWDEIYRYDNLHVRWDTQISSISQRKSAKFTDLFCSSALCLSSISFLPSWSSPFFLFTPHLTLIQLSCAHSLANTPGQRQQELQLCLKRCVHLDIFNHSHHPTPNSFMNFGHHLRWILPCWFSHKDALHGFLLIWCSHYLIIQCLPNLCLQSTFLFRTPVPDVQLWASELSHLDTPMGLSNHRDWSGLIPTRPSHQTAPPPMFPSSVKSTSLYPVI